MLISLKRLLFFLSYSQKSVLANLMPKAGLPTGGGFWHPPHWESLKINTHSRGHFFYVPFRRSSVELRSICVGSTIGNTAVAILVGMRAMTLCLSCVVACFERANLWYRCRSKFFLGKPIHFMSPPRINDVLNQGFFELSSTWLRRTQKLKTFLF